MTLERMLADALREEAEARDVDVARMWVDTRDRLEPSPAAPRRRWPVVAVAAAAAAVVVGVGLVAGSTGDGGRMILPAGDPDRSRQGEVADAFTCPEQVVHDWTRPGTVVDKHFVASLEGGLEFQAGGYDVPRYELEVDGDRAFASFGNADGSLALRSEFHREDGEWVRFRSEVCTGEDRSVAVPLEEPLELRNHLGDEPFRPTGLSGRDPVLLDHRAVYDHVGVVRPRSLYAGACGGSVCISSLRGGGDATSTEIRSNGRPHDVSFSFLPNSTAEWQTRPYGMWAVYDRDGEVEDVTFSRGSEVFRAERITSDTWPGTLHLVVAPFEDLMGIAVMPPRDSPGGGLATHYPAEELAGFQDGPRQ